MKLRFCVRPTPVDLDLHELSDPHGLDRAEAVVVDGFAYGDSLRIQHALFGHHNDLGFHLTGETRSGSRKFNGKPEMLNTPNPFTSNEELWMPCESAPLLPREIAG